MRTLVWAWNSPAAAGIAAEPPHTKKAELTGGATPSASRRERGEGGPDERDPLVSDRAERRAHAQRPRGPCGSGPTCGPISKPRAAVAFSFSF